MEMIRNPARDQVTAERQQSMAVELMNWKGFLHANLLRTDNIAFQNALTKKAFRQKPI